jgi:hypothetical protein
MRDFQLSSKVSPRGEMRPKPVITTRLFIYVSSNGKALRLISFCYQASILTTESEGV